VVNHDEVPQQNQMGGMPLDFIDPYFDYGLL
jgi:hypothetical protein